VADHRLGSYKQLKRCRNCTICSYQFLKEQYVENIASMKQGMIKVYIREPLMDSSEIARSFLQNGSPPDALGEQRKLQLSYLHKTAQIPVT
jgi:hypothetical protein